MREHPGRRAVARADTRRRDIAALGALTLPFGPLSPALADIPFFLQAFVSGEGDVNGSFTNPVQFVIPSS